MGSPKSAPSALGAAQSSVGVVKRKNSRKLGHFADEKLLARAVRSIDPDRIGKELLGSLKETRGGRKVRPEIFYLHRGEETNHSETSWPQTQQNILKGATIAKKAAAKWDPDGEGRKLRLLLERGRE